MDARQFSGWADVSSAHVLRNVLILRGYSIRFASYPSLYPTFRGKAVQS